MPRGVAISADLTGSRLAHFELLALLGRGGMGEVYRARDLRLGRDVAIKILPAVWFDSRDRRDRFEREARTLASLRHEAIAALFDVGEQDGTHFLVMELVPGQTLARRLESGPLSVDASVSVAIQIARALEAAHGAGVVHRDLKPANVMIGDDDRITLLDFGLARALTQPAESGVSPADSPTQAAGVTEVGLVMGTPAYMSPEQTRGSEVDARTDIWALGCVLFEMLAGRRPFSGHVAAPGAASQTVEPDWAALPADVPRDVVRLLARCLARDARERLHHVADVRLALTDATAGDSRAEARREPGRRWHVGAAAAAGLLLGAAAMWLQSDRAGVVDGRETIRWSLDTSDAGQLDLGIRKDPLAIAPDGRTLAYVVRDAGGTTRLFLRPIDALDPRPVPGSEGASNPFFSPDGRSVGFFAGNRLRAAAVGGGEPVDLAVVPLDNLGATWGTDGRIVFASYASGLWQVTASGGDPELLTPRGAEVVEQHRWPTFLPDGGRVLFVLQTLEGPRLAVFDLASRTHQFVAGGQEVIKARYLSSGHLVFAQANTLLAAPFDPQSARLLDTPSTMLSALSTDPGGAADFEVSEAGTLMYVTGREAPGTLTWVRRDGSAEPAFRESGRYVHPRLSPDDSRLAVEIGSEVGARHLEVLEFRRQTRTVLAVEGRAAHPVWYPRGGRLAVGSDAAGSWDLYTVDPDVPGAPTPLLVAPREQWLGSFTPDGRLLVFYQVDPRTARDIWVLDVATRTARAHRATPANERGVRLSPSGQWLAYVSNEAGRDEIYVDSFPGPGRRWTVSTSGGREPVWSRDGRELFYREGGRMMAVAVSPGADLAPGVPVRLFEGPYQEEVVGNANFDVSSDGRFLLIRGEQSSASQVQVVLNWIPTSSQPESK